MVSDIPRPKLGIGDTTLDMHVISPMSETVPDYPHIATSCVVSS